MDLLKTSIRLTVDHQRWLSEQPGGLSTTLRTLINSAMNFPGEQLEKIKKLRGKKKFLASVELFFHPHRAARQAGVRDVDLQKWAKADPAGFRAEFREAQRTFIDDQEWMLLECVRGERYIDKQGMTGLIAFLNNHHPSWGRVKIELLSKIFNPIFDCLLAIVKESVDDALYQEIAEKFNQAKQLHFSAFSE
jgi:hypothetical protein